MAGDGGRWREMMGDDGRWREMHAPAVSVKIGEEII